MKVSWVLVAYSTLKERISAVLFDKVNPESTYLVACLGTEKGSWVNSANIESFAGCTVIDGNLDILSHSFRGQVSFTLFLFIVIGGDMISC
jgi:hypothetical protein